MKRRTIAYLKQMKARKVFQNPIGTDLNTFLSATFQLCHNKVVKHHIYESLQELRNPAWHKISA